MGWRRLDEFLARQTGVWKYEEVTKGMANTRVRAWYKKKVWADPTSNKCA